ncbi:MAG TPA: hypothetical protein VL461_12940 [Dictyobacter sp.]|nr:hypothetical protein [Dictyobacter sp.]
MANDTVVVGVFTDPVQAERAMTALRQVRFRDVGCVVRNEDVETRELATIRDHVDRATIPGLVVGAVIGLILGLIGTLVTSDPGLIIPTHTLLLLAVAGIIAGAMSGGLVGSFISIGGSENVPSSDKEQMVHAGRIIVIVQAEERAMEAFYILEQYRRTQRSVNQPYDPEATIAIEKLDK